MGQALTDGSEPVVHPAAGSHANKYTEALYLGSSAEAGVGCDDTRGPHDELRPTVKTIPSDPAAAAAAFPWITFDGRWGELQKACRDPRDVDADGAAAHRPSPHLRADPLEAAGLAAFPALVIGATLTLLGLAFVLAATASALVEVDAGRPIDAKRASGLVARRLRPLVGATALFVVAWIVLTATAVLILVAIWLAIRWSLLAPAVELEGSSGRGALRRSAELVRRRWLRVGALVGLSAGLVLAIGPLIGVLLIFATDAPLALLNIVAGLVYALALPFVALVTAYVYFDARARLELEAEDAPKELPAEYKLANG